MKKGPEADLEVAEVKMLRFSLRVTRMDKIRNEYIRGSAQAEWFGDKVREVCLRWFGHERRRDCDIFDQDVTRQEEKRKIAEKIRGCSEEGHADCWCDRGECPRDRIRWRQMMGCDNS